MRHRWIWGIGLASTLAVGAAACSPASNGPLTGPREGGAASTVCAPASREGRIYFGSQLRNTGITPVTITDVQITSSSNVAEISWGIDHAGYQIGTAIHPSKPDGFDIGPMLKRMRAPIGDVIDSGEWVTLVISPLPQVTGDPAVVQRVDIAYSTGDRSFVETDRTTFELAAETCFS
jgi:hypothetical protein